MASVARRRDSVATIRKRDGKIRITWEVQIRKRGAPSLTATFPSRREAREWAAQEETRIRLAHRFPEREAGRRTLQMTMRYAHLSQDHLASAVADLDRGLFGK